MTGALFMRPYPRHAVRVVKQNDTTQANGSAAFEITDGELQATLKAETLYEIRVGIRINWSGTTTGNKWRLSPSVSVAHAALALHNMRTNIGDAWYTATADPNVQYAYNTFQFNSDTRNTISVNATNVMFGRIKTTSSPCTLSIKWGTTTSNPATGTLMAGSWLYAREVEEI